MFSQGNCVGGFGNMGNYMTGGNGVMFIGLILIIGILIYFFSKGNTNSGNQTFQPQDDTALDILKRRFANSEISEEEYLAKKSTLS